MLLHTLCSCLILFFLFIHTSHANQNSNCNPSSCGNLQNITYPFRLTNDPTNCGDSNYELTCENNSPFINLHSHKFQVKSINYSNYTIRLSDSSLKNESCYFPQYSQNDMIISLKRHPFSTQSFRGMPLVWPVTFLTCPSASSLNSSLFINVNALCNNDSTTSFKYVKLGHMNVADVGLMCRIDSLVMNSMPFDDFSNVTISEMYSSFSYGFELSWFDVLCGVDCRELGYCDWDRSNNRTVCRQRTRAVCEVFQNFFECGGLGQFTPQLLWVLTDLVPGIIGIIILAKFVIGLPIMLGLLILKIRRNRHLSIFDAIEGFLQSQNNLTPIRYSYSDIKKMTRKFHEKLGEGGYGSVYKGRIRSGRDVAVKVLSKPKASGQDFINEVSTIGRIHHVNVVRLIGYCAERSNRALVYDYMPNGSLEKYIFNKPNSLTWENKYEIAVGVARGIEYLHRGCDIQILHFDIKPHNILLDDNFTPKVSDFGLAKFYSTENDHVTLTAARGTIGYVAPELMNRSIGDVSFKADVYSFGMLLMEMVGLKRNIAENTNNSSQYFPQWIYRHLEKGKDIELGNIDDVDAADASKIIQRKMTIVALWCIRMSPCDRPPMNKVVEMLEGEVNLLRLPPEPSCLPQIIWSEDQTWGSDSSDSMALLHEETSMH